MHTHKQTNKHAHAHEHEHARTRARQTIDQPTCQKTLLFRTIQSTRQLCANRLNKATAATVAQTQDLEHLRVLEPHKMNSQSSLEHPYKHATHREKSGGVASGVEPYVALTGPKPRKTPVSDTTPPSCPSNEFEPQNQTTHTDMMVVRGCRLRVHEVGLVSCL